MKKGELLALLAVLPDDTRIQVEIDDHGARLSWSQWELYVHVDTHLCMEFPECDLAELESFKDCVFFIRRKNI